jgi:outer membrane protein OmpA-like peptidoglycan-associated protein
MLTKRRRIQRAVLAILFLVGSGLVALSLQQGSQQDASTATVDDSLAEPQLILQYGRQKLQLDVTSVSTEHEEAVLQIVREQFDSVQARVDFQMSPLLDSGWTALSTRLLLLVAATDSAEAAVNAGVLRIRGTSSHPATVQQQLALLRDALPAAMTVDADILITSSTTETAGLCARSFAPIAQQTIHFRQTSVQIRESSYPLLDRLVEFAYDCRDSKIAVVGHTDSTGDESWNVQVSLARAQAVADYLANRGISSERLLLEGAGSARPLGDNDTVGGRERNRRIEFELR